MHKCKREWTFSLVELYYGFWTCIFKVVTKLWICFLQTHRFSIHKTWIDRLESCGLLSCFYQLFGFSWHPFTAEDPLVSKWCNAKFFKSVPMKNSSIFWIVWGWVHFQKMCIFGCLDIICFILLTSMKMWDDFVYCVLCYCIINVWMSKNDFDHEQ